MNRVAKYLLERLNSNPATSVFMAAARREAELRNDNDPNEGSIAFAVGRVLGWSEMLEETDSRNGVRREYEEIASWIMQLAREEVLSRVRLCSVCTQWFFAGRKDQKACSALCRHKLYRQSEHYKQDHRLYARWRYQHESGQIKLSFQQWKRQQKKGGA